MKKGCYTMKSSRWRISLIASLAIVLLGSGLYIYAVPDILLQLPLIFSDKQATASSLSSDTTDLKQENGINGIYERNGSAIDKQAQSPVYNQESDQSKSDHVIPVDLQEKVGQPIAKLDLLKGSIILMQKLSPEEIKYLSQVAKKDSYTPEEYARSKEILMNKLDNEDINMLKKIGKKYGSDLKILDQN